MVGRLAFRHFGGPVKDTIAASTSPRMDAPSPGLDDRRVSLRSASSGPMDIAAMANTDHVDHQAGVGHLVQDPVVANAHAVHGLLTSESDAARGPRLVGQQIYRCSNPVLLPARQPGDRLDRPAGDPDGVPAHSSPSAALTSSQGTYSSSARAASSSRRSSASSARSTSRSKASESKITATRRRRLQRRGPPSRSARRAQAIRLRERPDGRGWGPGADPGVVVWPARRQPGRHHRGPTLRPAGPRPLALTAPVRSPVICQRRTPP